MSRRPRRRCPDVDLKVLRLSTGDLGARILAEASNPQHDVIWGWAVTNMLDPRVLALTEPYKAKGADKLSPAYRAADDKWFAATGYMAAFCVNTERAQGQGPADAEGLGRPARSQSSRARW